MSSPGLSVWVGIFSDRTFIMLPAYQSGVRLSNVISGHGYSIKIDAIRNDEKVQISHIEVRGGEFPSVARLAFQFTAEVDAEGERLLLNLLDHSGTSSDRSTLEFVHKITLAYSCGEWSRQVLDPNGSSIVAAQLMPNISSFSEFVLCPTRSLTDFRAHYSEKDGEQVMLARIMPAAEVLELQLFTQTHGGRDAEGLLNILLPKNQKRTELQAHEHLVYLLGKLTAAFESGGARRVCKSLAESKLEFICSRSDMYGARFATQGAWDEAGALMTRNSCSVPHSPVTVSCVFESNAAHLAIISNHDGIETGLRFSFEGEAQDKVLTASQIRGLFQVFQALSVGGDVSTGSEGILVLSQVLSPVSRDLQHLTEGSFAESDEERLRKAAMMMKVQASVEMPDATHFLSLEGARRLQGDPCCRQELRLAINSALIRDVIYGARIFVVRLADEKAEARPDLFSLLSITAYPDGAWQARVLNGMGGVAAVAIAPQYVSSIGMRQKALDELCSTFSAQVSDGWGATLALLKTLGEAAAGAQESFSIQGDAGLQQQRTSLSSSLYGAGQLVRLLKRSLLPTLGFRCLPKINGEVGLVAELSGFPGRLELHVRDHHIVEVRVQCAGSNSAPDKNWNNVVAFLHSGISITDERFQSIVFSIRSFFRAALTGQLTVGGIVSGSALDPLSDALRKIGFEGNGFRI